MSDTEIRRNINIVKASIRRRLHITTTSRRLGRELDMLAQGFIYPVTQRDSGKYRRTRSVKQWQELQHRCKEGDGLAQHGLSL